jgi:hypothetical protein
MSEDKIESLMKKHPSWLMFDFHPMRFAKKLSEEEQENEKRAEVGKE